MDERDRFMGSQSFFDGWTIEEEIGEGSFGTVYRVSKEVLGTRYESAVKIIRVPTKEQYRQAKNSLHLDAPSLNSYFYNMVTAITEEVNILHSLSGKSNILTYHDHKVIEHEDHTGWDILIRMEYSTPLPKFLEKGKFNRGEVVRLGTDIAAALSTCKGYGILHRDIKETNIFVSSDGTFKLGDFGVSKELGGASNAGSMRGTPLYMAPEIFQGKKYDERIDIYSLGLVMYELANNLRMPFFPKYPNTINVVDIDKAHDMRLGGEEMPMPERAGYALGAVILKACAFKPEDRYNSAQEMRRALEEALGKMNAQEREENLMPGSVQKPYMGTVSIWPKPELNPDLKPIEEKPLEPLVSHLSKDDKGGGTKEGGKSKWKIASLIAVMLLLTFAGPSIAKWVIDKYPIPTAVVAPSSTVQNTTATTLEPPLDTLATYYSGDFTYTLDEYSNAVITGYTGNGGVVSVPGALDRYKVTAIGARAFQEQSSLTAVILPVGLQTIGHSAFIACENLFSVTLPEGLQIIHMYAFQDCVNLAKINFPKELQSIDKYAFVDCDNLKTVTFSEGIVSIGSFAFSYCDKLAFVTLPSTLVEIDGSTFSGCQMHQGFKVSSKHPVFLQKDGVLYHRESNELVVYPSGKKDTTFSIPMGTLSIGSRAFLSQSYLQSVTLPNDLQSIGDNAFRDCKNLRTVFLPEGLKTIGPYAFNECESLGSIIFPVGLQSIGSSAFANCINMKIVTILEGLVSIDRLAFWSCDKLASVTLPSTLTQIDGSSFTRCPRLRGFNVSVKNPVYLQNDGVLYHRKSNELVAYPSGKKDAAFSIPKGTPSIGASAFESQQYLQSVTMPDELQSIGNYAFAYCESLTTIEFAKGLQRIGENTFRDCEKLSAVSLPEGLKTIENWAFDSCGLLETVNIPASVTLIMEDSFVNSDPMFMVKQNTYAEIWAKENHRLFVYH